MHIDGISGHGKIKTAQHGGSSVSTLSNRVPPKSTFSDLVFRPLSRPPINLINLLVLDILLIWDATGEGMDPAIGVILS